MRDIRDNKYPSIIELHNDTIAYHAATENLYNLTVTVKEQADQALVNTQQVYSETVIYGEQLKIDTTAIKVATNDIYVNTVVVYQNTVAVQTDVQEMSNDIDEKYELTLALTEGLGFTIDQNTGHMLVEIPAGSNVQSVYIDENGHMWIEII